MRNNIVEDKRLNRVTVLIHFKTIQFFPLLNKL